MRQSGLEPESLADNASTLIFKLLSRDVEEAISTVRFSTSEKKIAIFVILFAQSFPNLFVQSCAHLTYIYKYNIQKMYCQVFMKKKIKKNKFDKFKNVCYNKNCN